MTIRFEPFDPAHQAHLLYAVIAARHEGGWLLCRHRERQTWEIPGGHREPGEDILETARRECYEETGAVDFTLTPLCVYEVGVENGGSYGLLCLGDIVRLDAIPKGSEIAEACRFASLPENLTYPQIQPALFQRVLDSLSAGPI